MTFSGILYGIYTTKTVDFPLSYPAGTLYFFEIISPKKLIKITLT